MIMSYEHDDTNRDNHHDDDIDVVDDVCDDNIYDYDSDDVNCDINGDIINDANWRDVGDDDSVGWIYLWWGWDASDDGSDGSSGINDDVIDDGHEA